MRGYLRSVQVGKHETRERERERERKREIERQVSPPVKVKVTEADYFNEHQWNSVVVNDHVIAIAEVERVK